MALNLLHGWQEVVRKVIISRSISSYAVRLVRGTRPDASDAPDFIKKYVSYGASLRASQFLILGSKALALIHGRYNVAIEDIQKLAYPVFRHRILTNFHAESEGITREDLVEQLLEAVPVPESGMKD